MNRLGIMIDISHPSKQSMMQTLALTKAPIIASHSAVRALCDQSRNLDDEQLQALAKNGGVVQMVAFNALREDATRRRRRASARAAAMAELRARVRHSRHVRVAVRAQVCGAARFHARDAYLREQDDRRSTPRIPPPARATVKDFVDHIDYAVKLIGIDHVGISSDFDGGGGVDGWNDATETPNVTIELVRRGYTEDADREDLERQPAARDGGGGEGRSGDEVAMQQAKGADGAYGPARPTRPTGPAPSRAATQSARRSHR